MRIWFARRGIYDISMFAVEVLFVVLACLAVAALIVRIAMF